MGRKVYSSHPFASYTPVYTAFTSFLYYMWGFGCQASLLTLPGARVTGVSLWGGHGHVWHFSLMITCNI